jgi:serine/threonine protein kinase
MPMKSADDASSLSLSVARRVDEACDRFEATWKAGQHPAIEDDVAAAPEPERPAFLRALLALEIELRCNSGDRPAPDDYERRFPDHGELIRAVFAEAPSVDYDSGSVGEPSTIPPTRIPSDHDADEDDRIQFPVESPPPLPDRIGRYRVCGDLGGGGFGKVYLAHDDVMNRPVAIKVPSPELLASQGARELFLSEARSVGRLQHEGIVRAHDFGQEADGTCYIVYEFIKGTSLEERIAAGRVAPDEAAMIVAKVAEALHYAHLKDLVHRDIKPANILLDEQGRPHLTDFGLAVREEDLPKERGRLAGTRHYMSPEQVRREAHHIDGRTDIYSLGVVLYELLCGRRPFEAKTIAELEDQILHRQAKPPRQIKDSIPRELERICLKALSKAVRDRYTTAKDMAEETLQAIKSRISDRNPATAIPVQDVERRMASADEGELRRLLRVLQESADPVYIAPIFRCLGHPAEKVRQQAREAVHSYGWDVVSNAAEDLARRGHVASIAAVLDGLAAFEAHPQIVALLDRLLVVLKGDLRNRTILLLERKRLGLELDAVASLFRDIHSPYRIEKALGQGLFAAAYLAQAEGSELAVVVRVLRPEFAGQPHLRAQFLDLSKKALQLVHENVVLTREARAFPERNIYFAVRDYVNGVTLQKLLEGGKCFGPAQILGLLRQLLMGLGAVHRRGMLHGGVKPSNVFVCEEDRVVLGDPALSVQGVGVALERLCYDYRYAAPETFRSGTAGTPADFYSLGCVAYELACGEPPFVSDNYLELAACHLHEGVVPPSRRGSRLGPTGDEVLLKLLAPSPADRYARANDVLRALDGLEASWETRRSEVRPPTAPLLRDASLARFRGAESVVGFDASGASPNSPSGDTSAPGMVLPPQVPEQPSHIGPYEILEHVGRGGMGIVYKARDPRLERVVALKVLPSDAIGRAQLSRFQREALAVARLQHPHIVQIYDIGEQEGFAYVALEFAGGGSLAQKLREGTPSPRDAAELVARLARAVQHAHEQGVLHRDLKPSNVLLTPEGEPKIADFGLAKLRERSNEEDAVMTHSGMILGTPSYMSPEQAAGNTKAIGPAADVYGLGAILYESLTGRPPFRGTSAYATLSQLATEEVISPDALNPAVDDKLSAICLKCLEKDPQKRYSSAGGLAEDLERLLGGQSIQARLEHRSIQAGPVPTSPPMRWWRRWLAGFARFRNRR